MSRSRRPRGGRPSAAVPAYGVRHQPGERAVPPSRCRGSAFLPVLLLVAALLAAACATGGGLARDSGRGGGDERLLAPVTYLELHGLLVLMADQLLFEPLTVESALDGDPALREHLALTLGRIGDPRGSSYLLQLLGDAEPEVRRAAAFGLGELAHGTGEGGVLERAEAERAARALLFTAVEPDRTAALLAVEALGKLGVSVGEVLQALTAAELPEAERWARLLPHLYRFDEPALVPVAETALAEDGPLAAPESSPGEAAADRAATLPTAAEREPLRRGAAFALARNPRTEALPRLRRLAADPDPRIRAWAARALGLVGEPADLDLLLPMLGVPGGEGAGALPAAPAIQAIRAAAGLAERHGEAVTGRAPAAWATRLRALLDDPRPHLRLEVLDRAAPWMTAAGPGHPLSDAVAAVAAGETPPTDAAAPAAPTPAGGPADAGASPGSGGGAVGSSTADAPPDSGTAALPAADPAADPGADSHVANIARAERAAALSTLAIAFPERVSVLLPAAVVHPDPRVRAAAAAAAGHLPGEVAENLLETMLRDPAPAVRSVAATTLLDRLAPPAVAADGSEGAAPAEPSDAGGATPSPGEVPASPAAALAGRLLAGRDPGIQAAALAWLTDHPVLPYADLTQALQRTLAGSNVEAPLEGVRALAARAAGEPRERGGIVSVLEKLADPTARFRGSADRDWLVRRAAADALAKLERPAPPVGHPRGHRDPEAYQQIVQRTRRPQRVEMVTAAGTLTLELDCQAAPRTCVSFLQLAGQGFFDGLTFHRVVPDFVAQGGDPRGDGLGGPGYSLRDEMTRRRYGRGTLGMALAGPHTGGSQFFLTLSPQPHLDGGYTAFGHVVAGDDVLDRITRGTEILRVRPLG